jgi:hypothetical protein
MVGRLWPGAYAFHIAADQYWNMNPDVKNARVDPWFHYSKNGKNEGREWPGAMFFDGAVRSYLGRYSDIARDGFWKAHAWLHYVKHGRFEGRYWSDAIGYDFARQQYMQENGLVFSFLL